MSPCRESEANGRRGALVVFCGVDGSGKSTCVGAAEAHLRERGATVFKTQLPTGRVRQNALFREFVDGADTKAESRVDFMGIQLMVLADLIQHVEDTIRPRVEAGEIVVCDRFLYTVLSEARARSRDPEIATICDRIALRVPRPDVAFLLDVPADVARARVQARPEESHLYIDPVLLSRQINSYRLIAKQHGLVVVSTAGEPGESARQICAHLDRTVLRQHAAA